MRFANPKLLKKADLNTALNSASKPGERSAKDEQVDRGFQLDGRYNLSELAAVFKIAVRIDNLVECKNSVDDWL